MPDVKQRPILFKAPMVNAILEGRKSMTRRVVKPQPDQRYQLFECHRDGTCEVGLHIDSPNHYQISCPYGKVGDRLWVKETWIPDPNADHDCWDDHTCTYVEWSGCGTRIDEVPPAMRKPEHCIYRASWNGGDLIWKPSIFMPRWASRITLEITGVRVERLQDISNDDAVAEGCPGWYSPQHPDQGCTDGRTPSEEFCELWQSINGPGSWEANPWVWVISFKRVEIANG